MFDNRGTGRRGGLHLAFEAGGKRIVYAYIRKNACSAFKQMLCGDPDADVRTIAPHFPCAPGEPHDAALFVYRDPLERIVSLYRNKVLERRRADDILARYRERMGRAPGSLADFVRFAGLLADPHCHTQYSHLRAMRYSHAIPMHRLYPVMRSIVGEDAARHFAHPVNTSRPADLEISDEVRALVREHYAEDYRMIREIETPALHLVHSIVRRVRAARRHPVV